MYSHEKFNPQGTSKQSQYLTENYTYPSGMIETINKYPPFIPDTVMEHLKKIKSPILDDPLIIEVLALGRVSDADCAESRINDLRIVELNSGSGCNDDLFDWSYFLTKLDGYQLQKLIDAYTSILENVTLNQYYKKYYEEQLKITQTRLKRILHGVWTSYWEPDSEVVKDGFLYNAGPPFKGKCKECDCKQQEVDIPWYFHPLFYIPILVVIGLIILFLIYSLIRCKNSKQKANMFEGIFESKEVKDCISRNVASGYPKSKLLNLCKAKPSLTLKSAEELRIQRVLEKRKVDYLKSSGKYTQKQSKGRK